MIRNSVELVKFNRFTMALERLGLDIDLDKRATWATIIGTHFKNKSLPG